MRPSSKHPLVRDWFSRLGEAAADLPEERRAKLLAEAVEQLDRSLAHARTDDEVRAVLDTFAEPSQVVEATRTRLQAEANAGAPTGGLGLYLGIVGMVFMFLPEVGIAIGVVALVVSVTALLRRRGRGMGGGLALGGVIASVLAIVLPLVFWVTFDRIAEGNSEPTPRTVQVGG